MILTRYLRKNIFRTFVVTFFIWLMLFIVQQLIVAFNKVSHGAFPTDFIFKFISYNLPSVMVYFVPFALFLGILLTFIRMYNNQEIIAMFSCGIKYRTVFFSFFPLTIVIALFNLVNSLYISPILLTESYNQISYLRNNPTFSLLKPGSFNNIPGTNYIVFAQSISGNQAQEVYIFNVDTNQSLMNNSFIYAHTALITNVNDKRQIQLINGQMVEQNLRSDLFQQLILQLPVLAKSKIVDYCLVNYPQVKTAINSSMLNTSSHTSPLTPKIDQSPVNLSYLSDPNVSKFNADECRRALLQFALANHVVNPQVDPAPQPTLSSNQTSAPTLNTTTKQTKQPIVVDANSDADNNENALINRAGSNSSLTNSNSSTIMPTGTIFKVGDFTFRGFGDQPVEYDKNLPLPGQSFKLSQFQQAYEQAIGHEVATAKGGLLFNSADYGTDTNQLSNLSGHLYLINFKSLYINLNKNSSEENLSRFKYQTIFQLLDSNQPNAKIEIIFRIISSLSILMLAIMAFTFGKVNPRATKNSNIIVAVVLYFVYLLISQSFRGLISRNVPITNGLILYISTNVIFIILIYLLTTDRIAIKNNRFVDKLRYFFGVQ